MRKNRNYYIRKAHRYLGIFIGIQFLGWTLSGLYFSWTEIDEIHGDQFHQTRRMSIASTELLPLSSFDSAMEISSYELRFLDHQPHYWVNDSLLYDATSGRLKSVIAEQEAVEIAKAHLSRDLTVIRAELLQVVGSHHEYRGRPLPAWAIHFDHPENLTAYVDARNGNFERVRHSSWRWFDFLWMFHTMDYAERDNFNNWLLRAFSVFGLITVLSGFILYTVSSPTLKKLNAKSKIKRK
jgi:uncharacterized iron-regulated membrane protein